MSKKHYSAFKIDYKTVVNALFTQVSVGSGLVFNQNDVNNVQFQNITALWDTGATNSVISQSIATKLKLVPIDRQEIAGVNGTSIVDVHIVSFLLPMPDGNPIIFPNLRVNVGILHGFDMLIGMDVIQNGDFSISNAQNHTHFSFCVPPHDRPICLYEKSLKINKRK